MSVDYNSSSPEQISFDGRHGEDVTDFLRDVKRIALAEGQLHNDQWLIDYAETCLAGPALKWFLDLDDDVLASWRGLQKALIERFDSAQATLIAQQPAPDALQPIVRPAESSLPPTASELPPRELKVRYSMPEHYIRSRKPVIIVCSIGRLRYHMPVNFCVIYLPFSLL